MSLDLVVRLVVCIEPHVTLDLVLVVELLVSFQVADVVRQSLPS